MNPQRELEKGHMKVPDEVELEDEIAISGPAETFESRRVHGKWRVSPLREAGTLLGVLKQEGLAGKGLIRAFEKWLPRIVRVSRADANKVYRQQTGREMSDEILIQKADKTVRYKQLPPEAEIFRRIILRSGQPDKKPNSCRQTIARRRPAKRGPGVASLYKVRVEVRSETGEHDSIVLVGAQERGEATKRASSQVADFFGVPAKTVTAARTDDCPLEEFLVIDGYVVSGFQNLTVGNRTAREKANEETKQGTRVHPLQS